MSTSLWSKNLHEIIQSLPYCQQIHSKSVNNPKLDSNPKLDIFSPPTRLQCRILSVANRCKYNNNIPILYFHYAFCINTIVLEEKKEKDTTSIDYYLQILSSFWSLSKVIYWLNSNITFFSPLRRIHFWIETPMSFDWYLKKHLPMNYFHLMYHPLDFQDILNK